jgi:hypothetical protein
VNRTEQTKLLAEQVLSPIGLAHDRLASTPLVGFMSMAGRAYAGDLMVVGRALNGTGWADKTTPVTLAEPAAAQAYADAVTIGVSGGIDCPMNWVVDRWGAPEDYNTKKSAFWRSVRAVLSGIDPAAEVDAAWPSRLVWSNLYKVSPADEGNPGERLCKIQLPGCIKLLEAELASYQPRRLLFLTGWGWAKPFVEALGLPRSTNPAFTQVEAFGEAAINGKPVKFAIASHPQRKPGDIWVSEVLSVLK